jgi:Replication-relaxation
MSDRDIQGSAGQAGRRADHVAEPKPNYLVSAHETAFTGADSMYPTGLHPLTSSAQSADAVTPFDVHAPVVKPAPRTGHRMLDDLRLELSARDVAITRSVADFRYLTTKQIETLHFHTHASQMTGARKARTALDRLTGHRVLVRLERRVGGIRAGSSSYIYGLGPVGCRLVAVDGNRVRPKEPSPAFLTHTLAVAQLAIDLETRMRSEAPGTPKLEIVTEPQCWQTFASGIYSARDVLKPDLSVVTGDGEYEYRWFVEIDLGTESGTAIKKKAEVYLAYLRTGIEQKTHGIFRRVLFVTPEAKRAAFLERVFADMKQIPDGLFIVTQTPNALTILKGGTP